MIETVHETYEHAAESMNLEITNHVGYQINPPLHENKWDNKSHEDRPELNGKEYGEKNVYQVYHQKTNYKGSFIGEGFGPVTIHEVEDDQNDRCIAETAQTVFWESSFHQFIEV